MVFSISLILSGFKMTLLCSFGLMYSLNNNKKKRYPIKNVFPFEFSLFSAFSFEFSVQFFFYGKSHFLGLFF